ncbi:MAG: hypothetical protein QQN41_13775, partial [Nitrosopumilus sp.]
MGFYKNSYGTGFCWHGPCKQHIRAITTWQIPIRVKYRYGLTKDRIGITGHLGLVYMYRDRISGTVESRRAGFGSW